MTCTAGHFTMLSATLQQRVKKDVVEVSYYQPVVCSGHQDRWSLLLAMDEFPPDLYGDGFRPGAATARLRPLTSAFHSRVRRSIRSTWCSSSRCRVLLPKRLLQGRQSDCVFLTSATSAARRAFLCVFRMMVSRKRRG